MHSLGLLDDMQASCRSQGNNFGLFDHFPADCGLLRTPRMFRQCFGLVLLKHIPTAGSANDFRQDLASSSDFAHRSIGFANVIVDHLSRRYLEKPQICSLALKRPLEPVDQC